MKRPLIAVTSGLLLVLFGCSDDLPTGTTNSAQTADEANSTLTPALTDASHGVSARATPNSMALHAWPFCVACVSMICPP